MVQKYQFLPTPHKKKKLKYWEKGCLFQTKSHIFLYIGMFCKKKKKKITSSINADYIAKVNTSSIFTIFCPKLTFLHQNWHDKNICPFAIKFAQHDFITVYDRSQHFSHIYIFKPKIEILASKLILTKTFDLFAPKFAQVDFITVHKFSLICPKTNNFLIKWQFFPKENNATKNTSLRTLNISTRN